MTAFLFAVASPARAETTRIAGVIYQGDLPTLVADQRGYFSRDGFSADVTYSVSGTDSVALLRAGKADFALTSLTPFVVDRLADATPGEADDPAILASLVHSTRFVQLSVLADGSGRSPADLEGRRIGVMKGTNAEFAWWLFAHYHGLNPASAELVDLPIGALGEALIDGRIDAAVLWEPWTSRLRQRVGDRLRTLPGSASYTVKWVLLARRELTENDAARTRAVLAGYRDAMDFIEDRPHTVMRMYADHAGLAPETLRADWDVAVFDLDLDWSVIALLQEQFEWAARVGYRSTGTPPEILPLLAPEPLRDLVPAVVGIPRQPQNAERARP